MNITYIFNQDSERRHLKAWLKHHYPKPRLIDGKPLIVAPSKMTEKYSSLIGTSFDYLFRFKIESQNINRVVKREKWVAETAFEILTNIKNDREDSSLIKLNSLSGMPYHPFASKSQKETIFFLEHIKGKLELAKENYSSFIYDGILTNEIVETCIFLGKLDVYKRCFKLPEDITKKPSKYVIEEIKQLYSATDWKYFKAKKHCFLNPSLGSSKSVVSGDADLIIDDILIDLKTSKTLELKRGVLNQLLGYYFLSLIHPQLKKEGVSICKIGIYLARFNYLIVIPISDFHDMKKVAKQKREFFRLVNDPSLELI